MISDSPSGPKSLREHLALLESAGLLHRVQTEVDPRHEIGAIAARSIDREGPALVFENIRGYPGAALATNLISSIRHLALLFGTEEDEPEIYAKIVYGMRARLAPIVRATGPCKEETYQGDEVDLYKFPTPVWHELDGGQYLGTTAGVITRDSDTGYLNMGTYRCMIKDGRTLSVTGQVRTARDPSGLGHVVKNEEKGRPTPVAIALGMDPYLTLASGTGVPIDEEGQAEFEAAGTWRGSPTELVRCETNDLLVPANAEVILEGEFVPNERTAEGPHGEATGFYGRNSRAWVIKINRVTQRKDPISYGLICRLAEDYPRHLFRSGSAHTRLVREAGLTNIKEVYFPEVGMQGLIIVSADIAEPDEPKRIMEAVWGDLNWRWVIVVDPDCDVRSWTDVMWRVVSAADPERDVVVGSELRGRPGRTKDDAGEEFEPPRKGVGIDATMRFKDRGFPSVNAVSPELMDKVAARWTEYGIP